MEFFQECPRTPSKLAVLLTFVLRAMRLPNLLPSSVIIAFGFSSEGNAASQNNLRASVRRAKSFLDRGLLADALGHRK